MVQYILHMDARSDEIPALSAGRMARGRWMGTGWTTPARVRDGNMCGWAAESGATRRVQGIGTARDFWHRFTGPSGDVLSNFESVTNSKVNRSVDELARTTYLSIDHELVEIKVAISLSQDLDVSFWNHVVKP